MLSYREFVGRTIGVPPDCREPFCPFGSKEFGHGWCNNAYSDQCYGCKESLSIYQERYILGNGGIENAE